MSNNTEETVTEQTGQEQEEKKRKKLLLPILLIIIGVLLAALIVVLIFGHFGKSGEDSAAFIPVDTIEQLPAAESGEDAPDITVDVILPEGNVGFEGTVEEPAEPQTEAGAAQTAADPAAQPQSTDEPAVQAQLSGGTAPVSGPAHVNVVLTVNDEEHTLLDCDTELTDGQIPDITLDFTILDFELLPGTYNGTMTVTMTDGETVEQPILVTIRQANSGSMSINFNPGVSIDPASGQITLEYSADSGDTHDTTVQLVLLNDGQEYILSRSENPVHPGEKLTGMTLDPNMAGRLSEGIYNGYLRLTFASDTDDGTTPAVTTDIEVEITVQ